MPMTDTLHQLPTLIDTTAMSNQDWLQRRRAFLGASDIAGILSLSPWASPWSVWADKVGISPPKEATDIMNYGKFMEPAIARWFEHETGLTVIHEQALAQHPTDPLAGATLDGIVVNQPELTKFVGLLEMKTADPFAKPWEKVPDHYACQAQWQMYVTGLDIVWFAVLRGRQPLQIIEMERDQDDIDYLVERAHDFWTRYVVTYDPPPTDGHSATLEAIGNKWPESTPGMVVDLSEHVDTIRRWQVAKKAIKAAEEAEEAAKAEILVAMGPAEEAVLGDLPILSCRTQPKTKFDRKSFETDNPGLTEPYLATTTHRVLREKAAKKGKK
jgi:putative phage-type endonuclease